MPGEGSIVRSLLRNGSCLRCAERTTLRAQNTTRSFASSSRRPQALNEEGPITAAPPIKFEEPQKGVFARIVPSSPSYFTAKPDYTDDLINLQALLRENTTLPTLAPAAAPRVSWKTLAQYRVQVGELVTASRYKRILKALQRLNRIHPALMPKPVQDAIKSHRRAIDPLANKKASVEIDEWGRAYGDGRRKSSKAEAWLVEGDGEVLINGKNLLDAFGRLHDRESALWALKSTGRLDKYNVFVTVHGGGTTGQAESVTLAVAKALMVHEPALKPALRRAGVVTRDPRRVERKKPGRVKARKMPTWVKR